MRHTPAGRAVVGAGVGLGLARLGARLGAPGGVAPCFLVQRQSRPNDLHCASVAPAATHESHLGGRGGAVTGRKSTNTEHAMNRTEMKRDVNK